MKIRGAVYEELTPRQRIVAVMDAIARDDTAEIYRLKSTCPFKSYRQRDAAFSDTIDALFGVGLAVETDLRGEALSWLACGRDKEQLRKMAAFEAAWLALLADMGITSQASAGPPRHPVVSALLEIAPEPETERVAESYAALRAIIPA